MQDGTVSGRRLTVAAQTAIAITNSGNAAHIALVDHSTTQLLAVTTCTSQALTAGGTVDVPTWDHGITDAT